MTVKLKFVFSSKVIKSMYLSIDRFCACASWDQKSLICLILIRWRYRAQKSCWYRISCGLFYHFDVCKWSTYFILLCRTVDLQKMDDARKIILMTKKLGSNLEVEGQICLKYCLNWRVYECCRMLTLTLWSITIKNVCIPKRMRSDLGVKLLKLVKSMVVTLLRLWKWMDIKQTLHTC